MNLDNVVFVEMLPKLDLHGFDRDTARVLINDFIKRIEKLSGYELYWQACIHTDTEHPHGHIVINRKDKNGRRIY